MMLARLSLIWSVVRELCRRVNYPDDVAWRASIEARLFLLEGSKGDG